MKRVNNVDDNFFSKDTVESFYWAGFVAADGCLHLKRGTTKMLSIALSGKDNEHLKKFKEVISFSGEIYDKEYNNNKVSTIRIYSKNIFDDLLKFGITPQKSLTLQFTDYVRNHTLVNHFMRGYFDGDGSFSIAKKDSNIKQLKSSLLGTKQFLSVYIDILEKHCTMKKHKEPRPKSNIYEIQYSGNKINNSIVDFLYLNSNNDTRLDRKYDLACSILGR